MSLIYEINFREDDTLYQVWLLREKDSGLIPIGFETYKEAEDYIKEVEGDPGYTVIEKPDGF